jgi:transmembrane sensor
MDKHLLKELLIKYDSGTCTKEEIVLLETWYLQWKPNQDMHISEDLIEGAVDSVWDKLQDDMHIVKTTRIWPRIAAAAAVLIFMGTGAYYYFSAHRAATPAEVVASIVPGSNKATLTLANGSKISLTDEPTGTIVKQTGVSIVKSADGKLIYSHDDDHDPAVTTKTAYNTINTPNGGQYEVVLPDGSHVWLNAASSIRYPTVFNNHERLVEITGEAYFEVAKNPGLPFKVKVNNETEVWVLGTHFNVNAYANEPFVQTTLAEGSIKLTSGSLSTMLSPGQDARSGRYSNGLPFLNKDKNANIDQVLAWKAGLFDFQDMPFGEAMRQLSRWYDVDVVYEDGVPNIEFGGALGRDVSFSKILFFLSKQGIHYRIEHVNRLVIMK